MTFHLFCKVPSTLPGAVKIMYDGLCSAPFPKSLESVQMLSQHSIILCQLLRIMLPV